MMDAVNRLPEGAQKPDRDLLLKLLSLGIEIEKKNRIVNREAIGWSDFLREKGYGAMLLNRECSNDDKAVFAGYMNELNMYGFAGVVMEENKMIYCTIR